MLKYSFIFCLLGMLTYAVSADFPANTKHHTSASPHDYHKSFYYFSAPEEHFENSEALKKLTSSGALKKNLRVIIIKPPEQNGYDGDVRNLANNAVEQQKEHIYLLNRKPDYASLANQIESVQQAEPEVHYVKYRHESEPESHHAQQTQEEQQFASPDEPIASESVRHEVYLAPPPPDDVPVEKSYARNFLPTGVDVTPGSSYIP